MTRQPTHRPLTRRHLHTCRGPCSQGRPVSIWLSGHKGGRACPGSVFHPAPPLLTLSNSAPFVGKGVVGNWPWGRPFQRGNKVPAHQHTTLDPTPLWVCKCPSKGLGCKSLALQHLSIASLRCTVHFLMVAGDGHTNHQTTIFWLLLLGCRIWEPVMTFHHQKRPPWLMNLGKLPLYRLWGRWPKLPLITWIYKWRNKWQSPWEDACSWILNFLLASLESLGGRTR